MSCQEILEKLAARFGDKVTRARSPNGVEHAVVDREHVRPILAFLRDEPGLELDLLADVTAVDHLTLERPEIGHRFAVVYQLRSLKRSHAFQVKARVPEADPRVPSVCDLWRSALWGERETHDMYGIEFEGNPDMRRLLMPEDYPGFPLRKDYPLRGRGERDAFPQIRKEGAP
ncbi:MAG: NADH-quinone oxidoreductase subunit C [Planctomycetes bacterium]|nr:NADH-quinone oxidoreductase subunit C [Planctomycetota bacterium]